MVRPVQVVSTHYTRDKITPLMHNPKKVSEADKFKASVALIALLIRKAGIFTVAERVAREMLIAPTSGEEREAAKWCRWLAKFAARDIHPDIGEAKEQAAAIQLFAEQLSAHQDPHRAYWAAVQFQNIDIPHHHAPPGVGDATGDLFFLDEFVQMVEGGSIRPKDGIIGETYGMDQFNWDEPRTQMQRIDKPETAVVEWCDK